MSRAIAIVLTAMIFLCAVGCDDGAGTISFHDKVINRADLSQETIQWLEGYNELTEEEQLSISYIPEEIHSILYGDIREEMAVAAEAGN